MSSPRSEGEADRVCLTSRRRSIVPSRSFGRTLGYEGADPTAPHQSDGYQSSKPSRCLWCQAGAELCLCDEVFPLPAATDAKCPYFFFNAGNSRSFLSSQAIAWLSHCLRACRSSQCAPKTRERFSKRSSPGSKGGPQSSFSGENAVILKARCFANLLIATLHSVAIKASAGVSLYR